MHVQTSLPSSSVVHCWLGMKSPPQTNHVPRAPHTLFPLQTLISAHISLLQLQLAGFPPVFRKPQPTHVVILHPCPKCGAYNSCHGRYKHQSTMHHAMISSCFLLILLLLLLHLLLPGTDRGQHICQAHLVGGWEVVCHAARPQHNPLEALVCVQWRLRQLWYRNKQEQHVLVQGAVVYAQAACVKHSLDLVGLAAPDAWSPHNL